MDRVQVALPYASQINGASFVMIFIPGFLFTFGGGAVFGGRTKLKKMSILVSREQKIRREDGDESSKSQPTLRRLIIKSDLCIPKITAQR